MDEGSSGLCKLNEIKIDKRPRGSWGSVLDLLYASCYSTSSYGHLLLHGPHTHACATTRIGHSVCVCVFFVFLPPEAKQHFLILLSLCGKEYYVLQLIHLQPE